MKASKKELEADFFRVGKKEKTMIYGFFILLLLLWSIPIYSLGHKLPEGKRMVKLQLCIIS